MPSSQNFQHKKSLGQHFLTNDVVPTWMCDAADITSNDTILEIGPGTGVLTKEILSRAKQVIALEADTRAIAVLTETFPQELTSGKLLIHHCDIRTLDISNLPQLADGYKIVANIPYYLSGFLFRFFLESHKQPSDMVYLVQKEVARRIVSNLQRGEKESLLSLSVKAYGEPTYIKTVSRGHFTPPPHVDSGIIAIHNISKKHFATIDEETFFEILHLGFGQKRKQLLGNLTKKYPRELLMYTFSTVDIPYTIRAEDIPLKKWLLLVETLSNTH